MKFAVKMLAGAAMLAALSSVYAQKGETVKIALIDPQTGLMGPLGTNQMRSWQYFADELSKNNPAGVKPGRFRLAASFAALSPRLTASRTAATVDSQRPERMPSSTPASPTASPRLSLAF